MRRHIAGPLYRVSITLVRELESCAGLNDFSTYNRFGNAFSWCPFRENWYMLVPSGRKKNMFHATVYMEVPKIMKDLLIRETVKEIIVTEFIAKLCGVKITRIDKPILIVNPATLGLVEDEEEEFWPESFAGLFSHS